MNDHGTRPVKNRFSWGWGKTNARSTSKQRSGGDRGGNLGEGKVAAVHVDIWSGMKFPTPLAAAKL